MVAWCPSDSNDGELVQVVFDDKSASTTLTVGEFSQSRAAYIAVHPYDKTIGEEAKERRDNERRDRGLGRGVGSRGGRSGRGTQLAGNPPPPPTNQLAGQAVLVRDPATVLSTSSSTTATVSTLVGRGGGRGGRSGRCTTIVDPVNQNIALLAENPPPPPTNQLVGQNVLAQETATGVSTSSSTTSTVSTLVGRGGRGGRSGRGTAIDPVRQNLALLAEILPPPAANQFEGQAILAPHPVAVIVSPPIIIVGAEGNGRDSSIVQQDILISGKRKRRKEFGSDELCMCSCGKVYDTTDMSNCKGINCSNRIRRTCVPLNWLCYKCAET